MKTNSWSYRFYCLFVAIILCAGLIIGAHYRFSAMDYSLKAVYCKGEYDKLLKYERQALLKYETLTAPYEIKEAATQNDNSSLVELEYKQKNAALQLEVIRGELKSLFSATEMNRQKAVDFKQYGKTYTIADLIVTFLMVIFGRIFSVKDESILLTSNNCSRASQIAYFFFSKKNRKEVFEPIISDWQDEYFESLSKKEVWRAHWINIRYGCAFLIAAWQKSPIGDLIEFIIKIAK